MGAAGNGLKASQRNKPYRQNLLSRSQMFLFSCHSWTTKIQTEYKLQVWAANIHQHLQHAHHHGFQMPGWWSSVLSPSWVCRDMKQNSLTVNNRGKTGVKQMWTRSGRGETCWSCSLTLWSQQSTCRSRRRRPEWSGTDSGSWEPPGGSTWKHNRELIQSFHRGVSAPNRLFITATILK